jgi:hypothetical protein
MHRAMLEKIDAFGQDRCLGRAETIRQLVSMSLENQERAAE